MRRSKRKTENGSDSEDEDVKSKRARLLAVAMEADKAKRQSKEAASKAASSKKEIAKVDEELKKPIQDPEEELRKIDWAPPKRIPGRTTSYTKPGESWAKQGVRKFTLLANLKGELENEGLRSHRAS